MSDHLLPSAPQQASAEQLVRAAEMRCAAVRAKDKATRTRDESEWVEIDKILFPDIWRQKNRQEDRQASKQKPICFCLGAYVCMCHT